ncbi:hypothetical protein HK098_002012 [Nowakowskiella sp. JEL0407]|nr:hypothetical protein HK098_002012 [Nowakowskiella sp. JEL0407]
MVENDFEKYYKQTEKENQALIRTQKEYYSKYKEYLVSTDKALKPDGRKDMDRLHDKMMKAKTESEKSEVEYKTTISRLESAQNSFETKYVEICEVQQFLSACENSNSFFFPKSPQKNLDNKKLIQKSEEDRITLTKSCLLRIHEIQHEFLSRMAGKIYENMIKHITPINVIEDLTTFIDTNKTGEFRLSRVVFQPFDSASPTSSVGTANVGSATSSSSLGVFSTSSLFKMGKWGSNPGISNSPHSGTTPAQQFTNSNMNVAVNSTKLNSIADESLSNSVTEKRDLVINESTEDTSEKVLEQIKEVQRIKKSGSINSQTQPDTVVVAPPSRPNGFEHSKNLHSEFSKEVFEELDDINFSPLKMNTFNQKIAKRDSIVKVEISKPFVENVKKPSVSDINNLDTPTLVRSNSSKSQSPENVQPTKPERLKPDGAAITGPTAQSNNIATLQHPNLLQIESVLTPETRSLAISASAFYSSTPDSNYLANLIPISPSTTSSPLSVILSPSPQSSAISISPLGQDPDRRESAMTITTRNIGKIESPTSSTITASTTASPVVLQIPRVIEKRTFTRRSIKIESWMDVFEDPGRTWSRKWMALEGGYVWYFESPVDNNKPQGMNRPQSMISVTKNMVELGFHLQCPNTDPSKTNMFTLTAGRKKIVMAALNEDDMWKPGAKKKKSIMVTLNSSSSLISKYEKTGVPPALVNVEGIGNEHFSNKHLIIFAAVLPLFLIPFLGLSFWLYPIIFLLGAFPCFILYNVYYASMGKYVRPQKGLPNAPITEYITFKDADLKKTYTGKSKIPIETFFEAYFDEKLDLNCDMLEALEYRYDWASFTWTFNQFSFFVLQWIPETLWHSRKQDEDQVRDHYDRGDDFYAAFLGPRMIYTSGIITEKNAVESLETLQDNKLALVMEKINLKPGDRLLDLGCGWGTLAAYAAGKGANVTGVTLGRNQAEYCRNHAKGKGVGDKVDILCMDYRDIPPSQKFDKITCLEMSEHVGIIRYQGFLHQIKRLLEDDGVFFLQIAGLRRTWQYEDFMWGLFMAKYVFPGADASPPLNWVIEQLERAGFEVASSDTIGVHYSGTIFRWYVNWLKNKDTIVKSYGTRWYRIWEFFLAYSSVIARQGSATCYQLVCHKNLNSVDRTQFINHRFKAQN